MVALGKVILEKYFWQNLSQAGGYNFEISLR